MKIAVKWWCNECHMYTFDDVDEHEDRHVNEALRTFQHLRDNDPANDEGDFSGASYDEWDGR